MPRDAPGAGLLDAAELNELRRQGVERTYRRGERLTSVGSQATEVFYLLEGRVQVSTLAANGAEVVLGVRNPGVFVGELSMLTETPRNADVVAATDVRTVMVTAGRFADYLVAHPQVAIGLLRIQSRRLQELTVRSAHGGLSVKARAAARLLELSDDADQIIDLTQADLARWIDASREWTSKALGELRSEGAIRTARGRIDVLDRSALVRAAAEY